jgi:hypothetical protein
MEHFTAPLLFPRYSGNDRWISDLCCDVFSLDGEAFALGYGRGHVLCDFVQRLCYPIRLAWISLTQYLLLYLLARLLLVTKKG